MWLIIAVNMTSSPYLRPSTAIYSAGRSLERSPSDCWCWFQQNAWNPNEKATNVLLMPADWSAWEGTDKKAHKDAWVVGSNYIRARLWGAEGVRAVNSDRLSFSQMTSPNLKAQSCSRRGWSRCRSSPPTRSGRRAGAGGCFASGSRSTEWTWRPSSLTRGWSAMEVTSQCLQRQENCQSFINVLHETEFAKTYGRIRLFQTYVSFLIMNK